ncbi:MAG: DUF177 domain-containing protein [Armatimonadetes bacterium]|nr:DUF177 domain-containing protein [Armatimonadota bacterium]
MRYRILAQLKKPHERVVCEIKHPSPAGTGVDLRGNLVGRVELTNTGKAVVARGAVGGSGRLTCSRCLKDFPWSFALEFTENCALRQVDDPAVYIAAEDEEDLVPIVDEELVDLSELVRQLVALEVPFQPLCKPDCRGLCPHCGAALDEEECRCSGEAVDPRWSKLKELLGQ